MEGKSNCGINLNSSRGTSSFQEGVGKGKDDTLFALGEHNGESIKKSKK